MELKDLDNFAIILCNEINDEKALIDVLGKICLKTGTRYNRVKIDDEICYLLYTVNKVYMFNMGANKRLKFIWKDADDFYIVDFSNNTKGNIISHLTFDNTTGERIDGAIMYYNLKKEFKQSKKVPLVSSKLLDEKEPYTYEHFTLYMENNTYLKPHNQI